MFGKEFWQKINLKEFSLPDDIIMRKDAITVTEGVKSVDVSGCLSRYLWGLNVFQTK